MSWLVHRDCASISAGIEDIFKAVRRLVKHGCENDVVTMPRTLVHALGQRFVQLVTFFEK